MQNVRSLKAFQVAEVHLLNRSLGFYKISFMDYLDVICLTETWLNESIMDHEILPTAYNIYRCDCVGRIGGGVMTAVKSTLSSTLHEVPLEFSSLEMVVVEISNLKYDRIVLHINCYRPPDNYQQFIQQFTGFLRSLDFGHHYSVIVVGDFNFPGIQWIQGSGFASSVMILLLQIC